MNTFDFMASIPKDTISPTISDYFRLGDSIHFNFSEPIKILREAIFLDGNKKSLTYNIIDPFKISVNIDKIEGQIFIDGRNVTDMPIFQRARLGMGYLPQESSIFRGLTVEQNLRAVLETLEDHDDERDATLDDLMAEFGITHLRNTPSVSLSGGERRRLEIARALAAQPIFLLLDEPLAGIDPIALGEIRDLIGHLKTHGIGVLITDHNVRETLDIVDRAYIIHDGTLLMEGTPDEVVQHSGVRQVYLGERFSI